MTDFLTDFLQELEALRADSHYPARPGDPGGGGVGEMGRYDLSLRPSLGHQMQADLRDTLHRYHGDRANLQDQLSQLCFNLHHLYTSPHPPSPAVKQWRKEADSGPGQARPGETAAARGVGLPQLPQERFSSLGERQGERRKSQGHQEDVSVDPQSSGRRNTLLPPIPARDTPASDREQREESGTEGGAQPERGVGVKKEDVPPEKKALRFGARVELKTPARQGGKGRKPGARRKSVLKDKAASLLKLPTVYSPCRPARRYQWDSGHNTLQARGAGHTLRTSRVRDDCQVFSHRSVNLPPVQDRRRTEVRDSRPIPRGLTKARLQAASRLRKPLTVLYTESGTPVNEGPRGSFGTAEAFSVMPATDVLPELDDSATVLTTSEDGELGRGDDLPPLPVIRLTESKLSGHCLQPTTRHVPRLRLTSPGLLSVTTGRSGATGLTAATYMSQETLEWKGEYMATGCRARKDRMLEEIIHIVRQRMRENEEDLKMAGHDPRPSELQSPDGDDDVTFWERNVQTPSSGIVTATSTTRRQPQRRQKRRKKQQASGGDTVAPKSSGAKLHMYMQKLSHKRKATKQRPARDRVRFQLTHMSIREITQSSMGQASTLHTATHTPLAA